MISINFKTVCTNKNRKRFGYIKYNMYICGDYV